ncbi:DUF2254 domain-containing protein [Dongia deserti]|uniref:DUF2254 domain-containing protein n=1 Tax=Dongia deserti TaxID=2268030 RepID=UPI000E64C03F|nr:DUF2254 domain-containing protein [Dongia deserti]
MTARIRKLLSDLGEAFWVLPALLVAGGVILAVSALRVDRDNIVPQWLIESRWLYGGGAEGARTLLGTIAASTIGVTGTVFSITVAALSLAVGQMGPRLLRNFTRDRGNQMTLGLYLGTFAYSVMVLRSIRTAGQEDFVPHLALSLCVVLAIACVAMLVYFIGHIAGRINVDTVIDLVSEDARDTVGRVATDELQPTVQSGNMFCEAVPVRDPRRGYLQELDAEGLADWAAEHKVAVCMLVRPGDFVFPGTPIAMLTAAVDGADTAIREATALGRQRGSPTDLEFAVRQMVEVAIRALSPGVNDPNTAITVLDRLGALLCDIAPLHLKTGVHERNGVPVLFVPAIKYDELVDAMFGVIRRHSAGNADLLMRLLEVLSSVRGCERDAMRFATLQHQAKLVMHDAERSISNPSDLTEVRNRYMRFEQGVWNGRDVEPARGMQENVSVPSQQTAPSRTTGRVSRPQVVETSTEP